MSDGMTWIGIGRSAGLALALICGASAGAETAGSKETKAPKENPETAPALWGYGVNTCAAFLATVPSQTTPTGIADEDYLRYRQWLAGLVSGLNLATGRDVLRGAELDAAVTRIAAICKEHPEDDFFNASLRLVRSLGQLKEKH